MIAAAVTLVVGGFLHPDQDPNLPEEAILAAWLGDPLWVPSHSLLLVGAILLVPGLLGLLGGRPDLPVAALAVLGGRRLAHPVVAGLAAVGGVAWAAAPWAVGPRIESAGWLFPMGMLMAAWFLAVGVGELPRRRAGTPHPASTASGPPRR
jgi:hypothetical protein